MARYALFLRHGQSAHNAHTGTEELADQAGDRLTDLGFEQARAAGLGLAELGVADTLLTSPLRRARETAEAVGEVLGLEPQVLDYTYEMGGGEDFPAALARVHRCKEELEARPDDEVPLLVNHGIFTRFFLLDSLLGERFVPDFGLRIWQLGSVNCGLTTFAQGHTHYPDRKLVPGWTCLSWMERPWDRPRPPGPGRRG